MVALTASFVAARPAVRDSSVPVAHNVGARQFVAATTQARVGRSNLLGAVVQLCVLPLSGGYLLRATTEISNLLLTSTPGSVLHQSFDGRTRIYVQSRGEEFGGRIITFFLGHVLAMVFAGFGKRPYTVREADPHGGALRP